MRLSDMRRWEEVTKKMGWKIALVILISQALPSACAHPSIPITTVALASSSKSESDLTIYKVEPLEKIIPYKDNLTLTCYVNANDDHRVNWEWLQNTTEDGEGGFRVMTGDGISTDAGVNGAWSELTLDSVSNPEGTYTCKASKEKDGRLLGSNTWMVVEETAEQTVWLWQPISLVLLAVTVLLMVNVFRRKPAQLMASKETEAAFFLPPEPLCPLLPLVKRRWGVRGDEEMLPLSPEGRGNLEEPFAGIRYDRNQDIKKTFLIPGKLLGSGQFGEVHYNTLLDTTSEKYRPVAKKSFKIQPNWRETQAQLAYDDFLKEIQIGIYLDAHPFVVKYIGANTEEFKTFGTYILAEYCGGGDLKSLLTKYGRRRTHPDRLGSRRCRRAAARANIYQSALKLSTSLGLAEGMATGMEYLHAKGLIHRDLAARNILLGYPGDGDLDVSKMDPALCTPKIGDFGLSHLNDPDSEYYSGNPEKQLPTRWLSVEALENMFSSKSDVWSFGIILSELFSLGELPYARVVSYRMEGLEQRCQLGVYLRSGQTLGQPAHLQFPELWRLMRSCWETTTSARPTFAEIREKLHGWKEELLSAEDAQRRAQLAAEEENAAVILARPNYSYGYDGAEIIVGRIDD